MTSNVNNAAVMSAEDYFTKNLYQGKIYKTNNMQGNTLAQYCPSDSAMAKEQKRIEAELAAFEKNIGVIRLGKILLTVLPRQKRIWMPRL